MNRSSPGSGASLPPFRKKVTCGYFSVSASRNCRLPCAATQAPSVFTTRFFGNTAVM